MILDGITSLEEKVNTKEWIFLGVGSWRIAAMLASFAVSIPLFNQKVDSGSTDAYYGYRYDVTHDRCKRWLNAVPQS